MEEALKADAHESDDPSLAFVVILAGSFPKKRLTLRNPSTQLLVLLD